MIRRLLGILGRRTLLTFGLVTFLVGALLATVNVTSRYALKLYVDDQLRRIPWDLAVYQQGAVGNDRSLPAHIARTKGVTRVESMAFLRARFPEGGEVEAQVDRKPFTTPWLCLLAASDPSILPPALSFALEHGSTSGDDRSGKASADGRSAPPSPRSGFGEPGTGVRAGRNCDPRRVQHDPSVAGLSACHHRRHLPEEKAGTDDRSAGRRHGAADDG